MPIFPLKKGSVILSNQIPQLLLWFVQSSQWMSSQIILQILFTINFQQYYFKLEVGEEGLRNFCCGKYWNSEMHQKVKYVFSCHHCGFILFNTLHLSTSSCKKFVGIHRRIVVVKGNWQSKLYLCSLGTTFVLKK